MKIVKIFGSVWFIIKTLKLGADVIMYQFNPVPVMPALHVGGSLCPAFPPPNLLTASRQEEQWRNA